MRSSLSAAFFLGVMLMAFSLSAKEPLSIKASANVEKVRVGGEFQVDLEITVLSSAEVKTLKAPDLTGFELVKQARGSVRQSTNIINGVASYEKVITHYIVLKAESVGVHEIGPVRVSAGNEVAVSKPFRITVVADDAPVGREGFSSALDPTLRYRKGDKKEAPPDAFYDVRFDRDSVFVGEQVVLTLRVYSKNYVDFRGEVQTPKLESFWTEELKTTGRRASEVMVAGDRYYMYEIGRIAAFPLKAMKVQVPPVNISARAGSGWRKQRTKSLRSDSVTLEVKPLPMNGRPAGFQSANVGEYQLFAEVNPPNTKVGEPVTLKIMAMGEGHVSGLTLPDVQAALEDTARVFPPSVSERKSTEDGRLAGIKVAELLVQPLKVGILEIPAFSLPYFDAKSESYKTASTKAIRVSVRGKASKKESVNEKEVIAANTRLIRRGLSLKSHDQKEPYRSALFAAALFLSLLLACALFALIRFVQHRNHSPEAFALKKAQAQKQAYDEAAKDQDLGSAERLLREALSSLIPGSEHLPADQIAMEVAAIAPAQSTLPKDLQSWFDAAQAAHYASNKSVSRRALFTQLEQLLASIDALEKSPNNKERVS